MKFLHLAVIALALVLGGGAYASATAAAGAQSYDAFAIQQRIEAHNPALQSFQARVHVNVHLLSFPWLTNNLDGTSYYKRPGKYGVIFDKVPSYAKGIDRLFGDIGDPVGWQKDWNVGFGGVEQQGGRLYLTLRLTKKIYSDQLKDAVAYVDPQSFLVTGITWHYRNGDVVAMTQSYKTEGNFNLVASQHYDIRRSHVHAVAEATFGAYQTNVAIADSVFASKK